MCIRDRIQPEGFEDGLENGDSSFTISNDQFSNIQLGFGEAFSSNTFAELLPGDSPVNNGASGNPPRLTGLPPIARSPISDLLNSFTGSPGPIYSGVPIVGNANPLSLESGRPVTGGYAAGNGFVQGGDCGCPEPINPCCVPVPSSEVLDPCSTSCDESIGFGQVTPQWAPGEEFASSAAAIENGSDSGNVDESTTVESVLDQQGMTSEDDISSDADDSGTSEETADALDKFRRYDQAENIRKPSVLKRFANWLSV